MRSTRPMPAVGFGPMLAFLLLICAVSLPLTGVRSNLPSETATAPGVTSPAAGDPQKDARTANVSATDDHAQILSPNPSLRGGDLVLLNVRGFAPGAPVSVRLGNADGDGPVISTAQAGGGASGILRLSYRVPTGLEPGPHRITLIGSGPSPDPNSTAPAGRGDMAISVTIPNLAIFQFTAC